MVVLGGAADSYERGIPVPDPGKPVPDSANGGFAMVFSCPGFVPHCDGDISSPEIGMGNLIG